MFINCPSCRALVATDPATDLPPERCPRCAAKLREEPGAQADRDDPAAGDEDARSGVAAAIAEVFDAQHAGQLDPTARPAVSLATLLQPVMDTEVDDASAYAADPEQAPASAPGVEPEPELDPELKPDSGSESEPAPDPCPEAESRADANEATPPAAGPERNASAGTAAETTAGVAGAGAPADTSQAGPASAPVAGAIPRRAGGRSAPSFVRRRRAATEGNPARRRWPIPVAIIALALLLAVQWLLADRARLAADAAWRPVVAGACAVLQCSLPPWHEPAAFVLLERDVRAHPDAEATLRITASFRNDARWAQAWPEIVLTLSDIDGQPLGTRAFTAAEYLEAAPASGLVDSGQGAVIRMDVVEPAPGAVSFAFDFH